MVWTTDGQLSRLGIALLQECTVTVVNCWLKAGHQLFVKCKFKSNLPKFRAMVWHCWRNTPFQMIHQTKGTPSTCSQPDCRHQKQFDKMTLTFSSLAFFNLNTDYCFHQNVCHSHVNQTGPRPPQWLVWLWRVSQKRGKGWVEVKGDLLVEITAGRHGATCSLSPQSPRRVWTTGWLWYWQTWLM